MLSSRKLRTEGKGKEKVARRGDEKRAEGTRREETRGEEGRGESVSIAQDVCSPVQFITIQSSDSLFMP